MKFILQSVTDWPTQHHNNNLFHIAILLHHRHHHEFKTLGLVAPSVLNITIEKSL
jgi:hypothetical protein